MKEWMLLLAMTAALAACGGDDDDDDTDYSDDDDDTTLQTDDDDDDDVPVFATVEGDAKPFAGGPTGLIEGATITVLEHPEMQMVTGADGHFAFDLEVGTEATFVMEHPDYPLIQTGTHIVPEEGMTRVTFQAPTYPIYAALAGIVEITPDDTKCQMVTTVTRVGKSIYDEGAHGEAEVTVEVTPSPPAESGPIYFNSSVIPQRDLVETSDDGGVLFTNVPPGEYHWEGHKDGVEFRPVHMKCRAGVLVNASPPWGLQALE